MATARVKVSRMVYTSIIVEVEVPNDADSDAIETAAFNEAECYRTWDEEGVENDTLEYDILSVDESEDEDEQAG